MLALNDGLAHRSHPLKRAQGRQGVSGSLSNGDERVPLSLLCAFSLGSVGVEAVDTSGRGEAPPAPYISPSASTQGRPHGKPPWRPRHGGRARAWDPRIHHAMAHGATGSHADHAPPPEASPEGPSQATPCTACGPNSISWTMPQGKQDASSWAPRPATPRTVTYYRHFCGRHGFDHPGGHDRRTHHTLTATHKLRY